jgi:predicted transcriptional regulator
MLHMKGSKTRRISVQLSIEEIEALQKVASASERSVSWVAARAIRIYLADSQKDSQIAAVSGSPRVENPQN